MSITFRIKYDCNDEKNRKHNTVGTVPKCRLHLELSTTVMMKRTEKISQSEQFQNAIEN
jgi:hypothetical protein